MSKGKNRQATHNRRARLIFLVLAMWGATESVAPDARATIQDESCIYPDVEYPMPCDEDDEDDD